MRLPESKQVNRKEKCRYGASRLQSGTDVIDGPCRRGIRLDRFEQSNAVAKRRIVRELLDQAVEESCHVSNSHVVSPSGPERQPPPMPPAGNESGSFGRMPQCSNHAVSRYRIGHRGRFTDDDPVLSSCAPVGAASERSRIFRHVFRAPPPRVWSVFNLSSCE
jgi:hypothetical protein